MKTALLIFFYMALDLAAYSGGGRMGAALNWYHWLPGGGLVRLVEGYVIATHPYRPL